MSQKTWSELVDDSEEEGGGTWEPIPEGEYDLKVADAEQRLTQSQKNMYVIKAEVLDGPYAGRIIWHNFVVSDDNKRAMFHFFKNMSALGIEKDFFRNNPTNDSIVNVLKGRQFKAEVGKKIYNDQVRNEIKTFYASANPGPVVTAPASKSKGTSETPVAVGASSDQAYVDVPPF